MTGPARGGDFGWRALVLVLALYGLLVGVQIYMGTRPPAVGFVYPLDDAYIHMAMAKNFAESGVWGVNANTFSSTSSSPLWTLILAAGYWLTGVSLWTPLILNILLGALLSAYLYRILRRHAGAVATSGYLLLIILVMPLPTLVVSGMEHVLHALLTVMLFEHGLRVLLGANASRRDFGLLLVIVAALGATRYEAALPIGLLCLSMLLRKRYGAGLAMAAAAALPVLAYACISVSQGWYALPNSLLLKGTSPSLTSMRGLLDSLGGRAAKSVYQNHYLLVLLFLGALTFFRFRSRTQIRDQRVSLTAALFLYMAMLHLQFANTGWLYRYEAYLVVIGFLAAFPVVVELLGTLALRCQRPTGMNYHDCAVPLLCIILCLAPLGFRAARAFTDSPMAMCDRYLEHILPAELLSEHYSDATVVANDIGALAFFSDCEVLDIYGLGSVEPLQYRYSSEDGQYTKEDVLEWTTAQNAEIAILQVMWPEVKSRIPDEWTRVAEWEIPRNVIFGDTTVGLFATRGPASVKKLRRHLEKFSTRLPTEIRLTLLEPPQPEPAPSAGEK